MRAVSPVPPILATVLLVWASACRDSTGIRRGGVEGAANIPGLTISAPVAAASGESVVYVSLAPVLVSSAPYAKIRNVTTGKSTSADLVSGGFDPVAIAASLGDTMVVEVEGLSAEPIRTGRVVTPRRPPVVVRTDPPPRKRDVPLNVIIVVVFSEPVDASTVGSGPIALWRGTTSVPGKVLFADPAHLRAEFHPDALLDAQTDYELVLSPTIRGVNGLTLESAISVPFTTGATLPATNLVFASVSVGYHHACGVTTSGAVYCWGDSGGSGWMLGGGSTEYTGGSMSPIRVASDLMFSSVSAGAWHTCGVTTSGAAYCWGNGGLGDGAGASSPTPLPVAGGLTFSSLSAGFGRTCGVATSGAVYCWGGRFVAPVLVPGGLTFATVSTGASHNCGLTTAGTAYCWGMNTLGELGVGTSTGPEECDVGNGYSFACSTTPRAVAGGLSFANLRTGFSHTCGATTSGAAYCWGNNLRDILNTGFPSTGPEQCDDVSDIEEWADVVACSRVPAPVTAELSFASVATGGRDWFACGLTPAGLAYCWGAEAWANHGITTPSAVRGGLTFATLSAGQSSACGVSTTGLAYCWGGNDRGELGNGTTTPSVEPVLVAGQHYLTHAGAPQRVEVTVVTTGADLDPDGYGVLNDEWDYDIGDGVTVQVPINGTVTLSLRAGGHVLSLIGVASNCLGENLDDRTVVVDARTAPTRVEFRVVCKAR